ncbi:hypothetical protein [Bradyrhizobium sp. CCGUVB23]|uniref:hypothetical protein n=1 Tax=Bradyrhizobium sp. CCGUVB23 TaxID=2949630 RepID=UPI0020B29C7E|nr:hypothetical protein [Bradyrhizobium sp. CCGUVB23]MCP3468627.1 hypothetical protein [Bradyrhizobium sp. CCGUVB23]
MVEVAKRLTTGDPIETVNNLTNFTLVSRSARDAAQAAPVRAFQARLNRLGAAAQALYGAARRDNRPQPGPPDEEVRREATRAHAYAPILKFQSAARKSATVDHIVHLSHAANNCAAIRAIVENIGDLDRLDRRRLIDQAIDIFERPSPQLDFIQKQRATETLILAHNHLDTDQKARIYDALVDCPERADLLADIRYRMTVLQSASRSKDAAEQQGSDLDSSIDAIAHRAYAAVNRNINREFAIREAGKALSDAYNRARSELMTSVGSRGRTIVGR